MKINSDKPEAIDQTLGLVLDDLDQDISAHPERLVPVIEEMMKRYKGLVGDTDMGNLNAPLPPDDE